MHALLIKLLSNSKNREYSQSAIFDIKMSYIKAQHLAKDVLSNTIFTNDPQDEKDYESYNN